MDGDGSHRLKGRLGDGGLGELRWRLQWWVLRWPAHEGERHEVAGGWCRARQEVGATSTQWGTGSGGEGSHQSGSCTVTMTYAGRIEKVSGGWWENTAVTMRTTRRGAYQGEVRTALGQHRCRNQVFKPTANSTWTPPPWTANPDVTRGDREADRQAPRGSWFSNFK
jgi:hypothetical protein